MAQAFEAWTDFQGTKTAFNGFLARCQSCVHAELALVKIEFQTRSSNRNHTP